MKKSRLSLILICILPLLALGITSANATASSTAIPYSTFNLVDGSKITYALASNYTTPWTAQIDYHLTANTTAGSGAWTWNKIKFISNDTLVPAITIKAFTVSGLITVDYSDNSSTTAVYSDTLGLINANGYDVQVTVQTDSVTVSAWNSTSAAYQTIVDAFPITFGNLTSIQAWGDVNDYTAGYATVTFDSTTATLGSTLSIVFAIIPIIIIIAVVKMVIKMLGKMG